MVLGDADLDQLDPRLRAVVEYVLRARQGVLGEDDPIRGFVRDSFDEDSYEVFGSIRFGDLLGVGFSRNYVVLILPGGEGEHLLTAYVVGLNRGSGRLFIHGARMPSVGSEFKEFRVFPMPDVDVRSLLGFVYDVEFDGVEGVLEALGRDWVGVRVQGDIVLTFDSIDNYTDLSTRAAVEQYGEYAAHEVLRRIRRLLEDRGVGSEITQHGLVIPIDEPGRGEVGALVRGVARLIANELGVSDVLSCPVEIKVDERNACADRRNCFANIYYMGNCGGFRKYVMQVVVDYVSQGSARSISISVFMRHGAIAGFDELINTVKDLLMGSVGWQEVQIGRHRIKYHGLPRSLTITYKPPFMGREVLISMYAPSNVLGVTGELLITHPEHEEFRIKLNEPRTVFVMHVINNLVPRQNLLRLRRIAKSFNAYEGPTNEDVELPLPPPIPIMTIDPVEVVKPTHQ
ncbi:MAG: hypothetical protein ACP5GZ_08605 [Vulcanisaeta sp.]|uniref:hypothetical protein n=1 Tax=Vulcanisaeta sp. TaxID=2020871 RepID=UPI003D14F0B8